MGTHACLKAVTVCGLAVARLASAAAQVETIEGATPHYIWVSHGRVEGHLPLEYSPAGAFSPDGAAVAAVNEDRVVVLGLREPGLRKVCKIRLPDITEIQLQSAQFLDSDHVLLFATGGMRVKGQGPRGSTPLLAFQWSIAEDALYGKINAVGAGGGFGRPRYFPTIGYLSLYKNSDFSLWRPRDGRGARITVPPLTQQPNLYDFSPDGRWLLLAQIAASSTPDPVVVNIREQRFVDALVGHKGTVLSLSFSRDSSKIVTSCEDGKVRTWSAGDWKLLHVLDAHEGPVHWAEFSPNGEWLASAGEDGTVRIWSVADARLMQTLQESPAPLRTVAFSPDGNYIAASGEELVLLWHRTRTD